MVYYWKLGKKLENLETKNKLNKLQMVQFECFNFWIVPFPHFLPLLITSSLCSKNKWFIIGGLVKRWKILKLDQFKKLQMVQFECFTLWKVYFSHFQPLLIKVCIKSPWTVV